MMKPEGSNKKRIEKLLRDNKIDEATTTSVNNDVVILTGEVKNEAVKTNVHQLVSRLEGVKGVKNNLSVKENNTLAHDISVIATEWSKLSSKYSEEHSYRDD